MSSSFWEFMYLIIISFFLLAYLTVMFRIIVDLFRDESIGGFSKAIWIIALFVVPFITALAYIIFRGEGMAARDHAEHRQVTEAQEVHREQGRSTCRNRNLCMRGCPFGGYFSSNASTLPWARKTGKLTVRPYSVVHSIVYDEATRQASGVKVIDAIRY